MKISAIAQNSIDNCNPRRDSFVKHNNNFTSNPINEEPKPAEEPETVKTQKMGIETLEHFSIFPKEKIDGRTVITA